MKVSRHAKNNMKLYGITEEEISETMQWRDYADKEGVKSIAIKKFSDRFSGHPLKVVFKKVASDVFVITTYPLKKKLWR